MLTNKKLGLSSRSLHVFSPESAVLGIVLQVETPISESATTVRPSSLPLHHVELHLDLLTDLIGPLDVQRLCGGRGRTR